MIRKRTVRIHGIRDQMYPTIHHNLFGKFMLSSNRSITMKHITLIKKSMEDVMCGFYSLLSSNKKLSHPFKITRNQDALFKYSKFTNMFYNQSRYGYWKNTGFGIVNGFRTLKPSSMIRKGTQHWCPRDKDNPYKTLGFSVTKRPLAIFGYTTMWGSPNFDFRDKKLSHYGGFKVVNDSCKLLFNFVRLVATLDDSVNRLFFAKGNVDIGYWSDRGFRLTDTIQRRSVHYKFNNDSYFVHLMSWHHNQGCFHIIREREFYNSYV